jgi:hypothetical protein
MTTSLGAEYTNFRYHKLARIFYGDTRQVQYANALMGSSLRMVADAANDAETFVKSNISLLMIGNVLPDAMGEVML